MPALKPIAAKFENRVRFNWGFWDGVNAQRCGIVRVDGLDQDTIVARHFDRTYAIGYAMGWRESNGGAVGETSQPAWDAALSAGQVKA